MKRNVNQSPRRHVRPLRNLLLAAAPCVAGLMMAPTAIAQDRQYVFNIDSQPLSSALLSFGRQADLSILAPTALVDGKIAQEIKGQFSAAAALDRMLAGSGLTYVFVQTDAVRIISAEQAAASPPGAEGVTHDGDRGVVVITGTNIRGVRSEAAPLDIYTRADITRTGATTTEQFVSRLPQNLGAISSSAPGARVDAANNDAVNAIDLRGLGVGTTLTLLNGHRMALSRSGQAVDVSFIPLNAIERVEVLTDGASAIYGSDAIGGVVNFILRDDYEGSETRLSAGAVSEGNLRQAGFGHTMGAGWDGGHGLVSYDYHSASGLRTTDRPYSVAAGPGLLTPIESRHTLLATGSQDITDRLTLDVDLGASWRKVKSSHANVRSAPPNQTLQQYSSRSDLVFGSLELDYTFDADLFASVTASYSELDTDGAVSLLRFNLAPPTTTTTVFDNRNSQLDIMGKLDGVALALPAGDMRFSVGGGVLTEAFRGVNPATALQGSATLARRSTYGFAEVYVPLARPEQGIPLIDRLSLSLAARYTRYDDASSPRLDRDFGDSLDPKISLAWAPIAPLTFRGTYGSSFRAPSLTQLDPTGGSHYLFPIPVANSPAIVIGMLGYAVPDLGPETADSYTLGFDFRGPETSGFELSATYYNIDYTNRIDLAPTGGLNPFATPERLTDLIYRPPSAAFIEEALRATPLLLNLSGVDITDPAAGAAALFARDDVWMYDLRLMNLAISRQHGVDVSVRQAIDTDWGALEFGANASHVLGYEQQGSPSAAVLQAFGVPGQPAEWRGRAFASASSGPLSGTVSVNYTSGATNLLAPAGEQQVDSWTTLDLSLGYDAGAFLWGSRTRLGLSLQNLLDKDPPFLRPGDGSNIIYAVGFDPTNANPLGRFVTLSLTQEW